MKFTDTLPRRELLQKLTHSLAFLPLALSRITPAPAADAALLSPAAAEAKKVKYVEDASKAQGAAPGSTCANCGLYQGRTGSPTGPCQIFAGKQVKAAGWCASWAPQM
jgi:hypothetical protein